mmetsp:Transcript_5998/g.8489  ORF Transcript_5998/g.8489 Transcript_5998/m.8489 type:complete len:108 (-) Transcript_5998:1414-1737(-)
MYVLELMLLCLFRFGLGSVIIILTDDMDARINGYNSSGVKHMNQLNTRVVSRGAIFSNYVVAYPLCSPSRSTILTGRLSSLLLVSKSSIRVQLHNSLRSIYAQYQIL